MAVSHQRATGRWAAATARPSRRRRSGSARTSSTSLRYAVRQRARAVASRRVAAVQSNETWIGTATICVGSVTTSGRTRTQAVQRPGRPTRPPSERTNGPGGTSPLAPSPSIGPRASPHSSPRRGDSSPGPGGHRGVHGKRAGQEDGGRAPAGIRAAIRQRDGADVKLGAAGHGPSDGDRNLAHRIGVDGRETRPLPERPPQPTATLDPAPCGTPRWLTAHILGLRAPPRRGSARVRPDRDGAMRTVLEGGDRLQAHLSTGGGERHAGGERCAAVRHGTAAPTENTTRRTRPRSAPLTVIAGRPLEQRICSDTRWRATPGAVFVAG